jgi:hypothetical protein
LSDARCPRCGGGFHCGAQDTTPCACGTVDLTPETLVHLRERYTACLCLRCLREIAQMTPDALNTDMKKPAPSS